MAGVAYESQRVGNRVKQFLFNQISLTKTPEIPHPADSENTAITQFKIKITEIPHEKIDQYRNTANPNASLFWPGITKEVINQVHQCDLGQKYQRKAAKEPILQPEPPNRACERLSSDLFELKGQQHLILTDQYSRFPVIRRLTSTTSSAVINHLKSIFAEHGIPTQLLTDNGSQYSSAEFKHFMNVYGVEHITSSPMYPPIKRVC